MPCLPPGWIPHLYEDHASGKRDDRPGFAACLKGVRQGDTLVAWKLDRLGRDLRHLVNIAHDLTGRGIGLRSSPARARASTPPPQRQAGVRHLRRAGRIRARADRRADQGWPRLGPRPWPSRRPAVQDDAAKLRLAKAAMGQRETKVGELCSELDITRQTLYRQSPRTEASARRREAAPAPARRPGTTIAGRCAEAGCR